MSFSIDAEKAFDRVNWDFLRLSLQQLGIGHVFLSKIMSLYCEPTARILVNGTISEPFHTKRNATGLPFISHPLYNCYGTLGPGN